jgi:two-component system, OmpR family, copper resistance phosphate regulon response regulator CusR
MFSSPRANYYTIMKPAIEYAVATKGASSALHPILVTDSDPQMAQLYQLILRRRGYKNIIEAPKTDQALLICQTQPISLVISDISKPVMDGMQFLEALRADPRTDNLPIIFVTTRTLDRDQVLALGANDYLCKPFTADELLTSIQRVLSTTNHC